MGGITFGGGAAVGDGTAVTMMGAGPARPSVANPPSLDDAGWGGRGGAASAEASAPVHPSGTGAPTSARRVVAAVLTPGMATVSGRVGARNRLAAPGRMKPWASHGSRPSSMTRGARGLTGVGARATGGATWACGNPATAAARSAGCVRGAVNLVRADGGHVFENPVVTALVDDRAAPDRAAGRRGARKFERAGGICEGVDATEPTVVADAVATFPGVVGAACATTLAVAGTMASAGSQCCIFGGGPIDVGASDSTPPWPLSTGPLRRRVPVKLRDRLCLDATVGTALPLPVAAPLGVLSAGIAICWMCCMARPRTSSDVA